MKKSFIYILVLYALITGCLYILAPLIHWFIGVSSHNYRVIITVVALIIVTIGIIRRSSILPWMPPCDNYPNIVHRRYMKNGTSATPCTCALKPLIFEFRDSAEAFECLSLK